MKGKKELDQRVLETIKSYGMLQQGEGVVAGVSGGADSVCLLAVLRKYREERKWTVTAVHVEHGLRGLSLIHILEGLQKIQEIMETLRRESPKELGGYQVVSARDYKSGVIRDLATGQERPSGLPASNVLYYDLTDDAWLCVRPSGTEPKVKFYYGVKGTSLEDADRKSEAFGKEVLKMIEDMLA